MYYVILVFFPCHYAILYGRQLHLLTNAAFPITWPFSTENAFSLQDASVSI